MHIIYNNVSPARPTFFLFPPHLSHFLYPPLRQLAANHQSFFSSSLSFYVMKLRALTTLLFFSAATLITTGSRAQPQHDQRRHRDILAARAAKGELEFGARQVGPIVAAAPPPGGGSSSMSSSQSAAAATPSTSNSAAPSAGATTSSSLSAGSASVSGTGTTNSSSSQPTPVVPVPAGANGVPALSLISSGMPSGTPSPVVSTYAPGATPTFPGAPALPAQCKFLPLVSSARRSGCWIPSRF